MPRLPKPKNAASKFLKRIAAEREERAKVARTEKHGKARTGKQKTHSPPARQ